MAASLVEMSEQVAGFMEVAVSSYGLAALTETAGEGGGADAVFGRRLIWEVFGGHDRTGALRAALTEPAARPEDDNVFSRMFNWVFDRLNADPVLEDGVAQALAAFYRDEFDAGNAAAMAELGRLLLSRDQLSEGRAAFRQAADAGHAQALITLARLQYDDRRDPGGARAAFQEAIESGIPDVAAEAQVRLGRLLAKPHGEYSAATEAFRRAIETGRLPWAMAGLRGLADVMEQQGDFEGAQAVYRQMIDSGDAEWTAQALVSLGELLESQEDASGAKAAFWQVLESPVASWAAHGLVSLVNLLREEDDLDGARTAYHKAEQTGNRDAPYALVVIAQLLEARADAEGARAAYQQAIDAGYQDPEALLDALGRLGEPGRRIG